MTAKINNIKKFLLIALALLILAVVFFLGRRQAYRPATTNIITETTTTTNLPSYIPSGYRLPLGQPYTNGPSGPPPRY